MRLDRLKLTNYRNHKEKEFVFEDDATLILGPNGSGKTNTLEAIHLASTTKSGRAQYDREVIAHNENFAKVDTEISPNGGKRKLEIVITKSEKYENKATKRVKVDGTSKTLNNFVGNLNSVLFTPHDIEIFTQSPSVRRKYIDLLFFQIDREYKRTHSEYIRAVRQRNKVLEKMRDLNIGHDEIDYWTDKVLAKGSLLQAKRRVFLTFLQENIGNHSEKLNEERIDYSVNYNTNDINRERLEKYREAEIATAKTLVGPHRDDFSILYNNFDVARFGSRGQKRTTLLAVKLCEIDFINRHLGNRPILLLDDIFSELDERHKEAVLNIVDLQQTIITSAEDINLDGKMHRINL